MIDDKGMTSIFFFGVFIYITLISKSSSKGFSSGSNGQKCHVDLTKINVDESQLYYHEENDSKDIIVVGVAGGSGSGKTTLSQAIYEAVGEENISYISHDSYYRDISHLAFEEREKQNFDHPDSLETSLLVEHLRILKKGNRINQPQYDFGTHSRKKETLLTNPKPIILLEGLLLLSNPDLNDLIDIRVFVDTEDDIRLIRRIQRDMIERNRTLDSVISQYLSTVRPMHMEYVEPSKRNAHIIVPVGLNEVALELMVSRLKASIKKYKENRQQL
jgi:uridine kinase